MDQKIEKLNIMCLRQLHSSFEKTPFPLRAVFSEGAYEIVMSFRDRDETEEINRLEDEKHGKEGNR